MRNYLEGTETQKQRAYSPAVVTQGGRTAVACRSYRDAGQRGERHLV